jgi:hypothetical protein
LTERADPSRLDIVRYVNAQDASGDRRQVDFSSTPLLSLENQDIVTVPVIQDLLPVVFFEGAVSVVSASKDAKIELGISNRFPYQFYTGELLGSAVRANRTRFTSEADLPSSYILRRGNRLPVDLNRFIYEKDYRDDQKIEAGDTIVVPFKQYFISVGGAVMIPGRYPFVPDRGWQYYVGLAGGIDPDKNFGSARSLFDRDGKKKAIDAPVAPEDSIVLSSNNPIYLFGKVASIISVVMSIVSTALILSRL